MTIHDEGLSTGAYIEFDIDGSFPLVLRKEIHRRGGKYTVVDTPLIMCEGSGRYGVELRPEFIRGGLIGGADVVTSAAPSTPRDWTSALTFATVRIGESANNFFVYLCAGEVKPKPFWTDGRGCNYVIQAGVNR